MPESKPIILTYKGGDTTSPLLHAEIPARDFGGKPTINKIVRQADGLYTESNPLPVAREGLSALDVFKDASENSATAGILIKDEKGKTVLTLTGKEAQKFLTQEKAQEVSHDHSVKELTGMIKAFAKDNNGLDGYENNDLRSYAKSHGLKLDYKDMKGEHDEILIQDVKSGKVLGKVDNIKIGTKETNYRN